MNGYAAIFAGVSGSLFGALFNYYLALKFGRQFLIKYGRYVFIKEETVFKMESYFAKHGHISTFAGRLIPAVRQYISFPAGIAKMNLVKFSLYTSLGAFIWVVILTILGYYIGENQELIHEYLRYIIVSILFLLSVGGYIYYKKTKNNSHA